MAADYILQEDLFKIKLEDDSGSIQNETGTAEADPIPTVNMARERT